MCRRNKGVPATAPSSKPQVLNNWLVKQASETHRPGCPSRLQKVGWTLTPSSNTSTPSMLIVVDSICFMACLFSHVVFWLIAPAAGRLDRSNPDTNDRLTALLRTSLHLLHSAFLLIVFETAEQSFSARAASQSPYCAGRPLRLRSKSE